MLSASVLPTCSQPDRSKDVAGSLGCPLDSCAKHPTRVSLTNGNGVNGQKEGPVHVLRREYAVPEPICFP